MSEDILINVTPQAGGTNKGRIFEKAPLAYPPLQIEAQFVRTCI